MSRIRGKDTKPEIVIRKGMHEMGFRFRLHSAHLPGKPDPVLSRYRAAIFVHGCFWHGHDCHLFRVPSTRQEFWQAKIAGNSERDRKVIAALKRLGWRQLVIWECAIKGKSRLAPEALLDHDANWIRTGSLLEEITGASLT